MTKDEAIEVCNDYLAYLDRQRERSLKVQQLARMSREGQTDEAKRQLRQLDQSSVVVFDAGKLEPAIKLLIKLVTAS
jgi:hypothetical protein